MTYEVSRSGLCSDLLKRDARIERKKSKVSQTTALNQVANREWNNLRLKRLLPESYFGGLKPESPCPPSLQSAWADLSSMFWSFCEKKMELSSPPRQKHRWLADRKVSFIFDLSTLDRDAEFGFPQIEIVETSTVAQHERSYFLPAYVCVERRGDYDYPIRVVVCPTDEEPRMLIPISQSSVALPLLLADNREDRIAGLIALEEDVFEFMRDRRSLPDMSGRAHLETLLQEEARDKALCFSAFGPADGYPGAFFAFLKRDWFSDPERWTIQVVELRDDHCRVFRLTEEVWNATADVRGLQKVSMFRTHGGGPIQVSRPDNSIEAREMMDAVVPRFAKGEEWPSEHPAWLISRSMTPVIELAARFLEGQVPGDQIVSLSAAGWR